MTDRPLTEPYQSQQSAGDAEPVAARRWDELSLGKRLRQPRTLLSFLIAAAVVAFAVSRFELDTRALLAEIRQANLLYLVIAVAAYYGSFGLRAARWRSLLESADVRPAYGRSIPSLGGLVTIYILSWFANCLVPAKLGDAYRGFLLKRRAGTSFSSALGTIFAERLADLVTLAVILITTGLLIFGSRVPTRIGSWMILAAAIGVLLLVGLGVAFLARERLRRLVPERAREHYIRLERGALGSFGRVPALLAFTATIWILEGVRLFFVAISVGAPMTIWSALFVALLASLLTAVPITPAGLGFVELGIVGALTILGVTEHTAASIAILDRVIAYWSVILVGLIVYLTVRWTWRT